MSCLGLRADSALSLHDAKRAVHCTLPIGTARGRWHSRVLMVGCGWGEYPDGPHGGCCSTPPANTTFMSSCRLTPSRSSCRRICHAPLSRASQRSLADPRENRMYKYCPEPSRMSQHLRQCNHHSRARPRVCLLVANLCPQPSTLSYLPTSHEEPKHRCPLDSFAIVWTSPPPRVERLTPAQLHSPVFIHSTRSIAFRGRLLGLDRPFSMAGVQPDFSRDQWLAGVGAWTEDAVSTEQDSLAR